MLTRIITAVVAIAVFAAVLMFDPMILQFALGIVAVAMLYECAQVMTKSNIVKAISFISGILILIGMIAVPNFAALFIVASIMLFMISTVALHGKVNHKEIFAMGFMTMYVSLFMPYISMLRTEYGLSAMLVAFISAWGCDTGAYFAGSFFGKHKLIPKVSPKKTVEGALGGIVSAMLCCQILLFITSLNDGTIAHLTGFSGFVKIGFTGIIAAVVSQLGDLVASAIKRDCGVKDYGKIFPGHGGFMDRFDSVILIAPLIYYIIGYLV